MFVFAVEYWRGPLAALDNRIVSVPVRRQGRNRFSVAMAAGSHPFPF